LISWGAESSHREGDILLASPDRLRGVDLRSSHDDIAPGQELLGFGQNIPREIQVLSNRPLVNAVAISKQDIATRHVRIVRGWYLARDRATSSVAATSDDGAARAGIMVLSMRQRMLPWRKRSCMMNGGGSV